MHVSSWEDVAPPRALISCVVPPGLGATEPDAPHLFVIGDSQACGVTGCGSGKPCTKVMDLNGTRTNVYCKVGAHTSEFASIVPTLGIARGDAVLIFLGSNDYDGKPDPTAIVQAIEAAGASYLWVGPPSIRGKDGTAPAHLQSVLGNKYFDSRTLDLKLRDGIHPNQGEFARWKTTVLSELAKGSTQTEQPSDANLATTIKKPIIVAAIIAGLATFGVGIYWAATRPTSGRPSAPTRGA